MNNDSLIQLQHGGDVFPGFQQLSASRWEVHLLEAVEHALVQIFIGARRLLSSL